MKTLPSVSGWGKVVAACLLATGVAAHGAVILAVTGTAQESKWGYVTGQAYTFQWTINASFTDTGDCFFDDSDNYWSDQETSDTPTLSACGGSGLGGAWVRPTSQPGDPYSYIEVFNDRLTVHAGNDGTYGIGLTAGGNAVSVLRAYNVAPAIAFDYPGAFTNPDTYFSAYPGTYPLSPGPEAGIVVGTVDAEYLFFTPSSAQVLIPEASALSLLAAAGLVALAVRRLERPLD
jgi:hypothetical protein